MTKLKKYFNLDYFDPILNEGGLISRCASKIERVDCNNNKILTIVPCLVGDFIATVPAIFDFCQRNKDKMIDIIVTPPLKVVVEKINGINKIFVAKSVSERLGEHHEYKTITTEMYEEIIILRASKDVLENKIPYLQAGKVTTVNGEVFKYGLFELFLKNILRRRPKQWRDFNFELLGGLVRNIPFGEIFNLNTEENKNIPKLEGLHKENKKIIIHTGASWYMMKWNKDKWIELLKKVNKLGSFDFIFIGSEKDKEEYEYVASKLDFKIFSYISKINLWELTLVLNNADYFIGIDSGPGNIAHLVDLRSVIIYGPGPHTFMSHHKEDVIIDKSNGRGLYQRYFVTKNGFIHKINPEEVYESFKKMYLKTKSLIKI